MTLKELEEFVLSLDEAKYRARQIYTWLYKEHIADFNAMLNIPFTLREKLLLAAELDRPEVVSKQISKLDSTMKLLLRLSDGKAIETVVIPPRSSAVDAEDRMTICISTQVGCPLDCKFCATASMGFVRNLTVGEILYQFVLAGTLSSKPITNIVFMGMGEPMLNYDNVMNAIDLFADQQTFGISPKRITISTAGYTNGIRRMADEQRKPKLALSLHSTNDQTRSSLMPINKKYSVQELIEALEYYNRTTRKSVMLEYIVFDGVNDSDADASALAKIARRIDCRINLIPFHSISFISPQGFSAQLHGASREGINRFWQKLRDHNVPTFIRHSAGVDIDAACGQLATKIHNQQHSRQHAQHADVVSTS